MQYLLLHLITKDTNEQPDEEVHRVRFGSLVGLGCLPAHGCIHQLESSPNPPFRGFHAVLLCRQNDYVTGHCD